MIQNVEKNILKGVMSPLLDQEETLAYQKSLLPLWMGLSPSPRGIVNLTSCRENLGTEPWEVPFGFVSSGMNIIDSLYSGYGDVQPYGKGPNQNEIYRRGNAYLKCVPLTYFKFLTLTLIF
jgi:hypothetical protein